MASVLHQALSETRAALEGLGGQPLTTTKEVVIEVLTAPGRRKGYAPGPNALTNEVLVLLGEATAAYKADVLRQCCIDWETTQCHRV